MKSCKACSGLVERVDERKVKHEEVVGVEPFLDMGRLPLGNAFLKEEEVPREKTFPLVLGFCDACKLVQQISPPPIAYLVSDYQHYKYVPTGSTLKKHYEAFGRKIAKEFPRSFVVDVGSNDGRLLRAVMDAGEGCRVLGVEPAVEISETARQSGVPTMTEFFSTALVGRIFEESGLADVVTCTQTLQHISYLKQMVRDVHQLLMPGGVFVVEGRYFGDTVRLTSFDTIYHEMLYFFTLTSLRNLLDRAGFAVFRAEPVDVYGGSLRVYAQKTAPSVAPIPTWNSVNEVLLSETKAGLDDLPTYREFALRTGIHANTLHSEIVELKAKGKRIAGYGAPSTGTTLLNFCGIGKKHLDYIVDDSPLKQGLLQPGTHIPIVGPEVMREKNPDYVLLLAWRLREEILPKIREVAPLASVIVPLPEYEVV